MNEISINAPSKVNIMLRVLGRRSNGYHNLEMVMVPLTLCDEIRIIETDSMEFFLSGMTNNVGDDDKNLAYRAAIELKSEFGISKNVRIELNKRIPVAAGLGGGSSDAASVLKGLNLLWNLGLSPDKLAEIGGRLGSDIPFFCHEGAAYVRGIGDEVYPYEFFPDVHFLLVNPRIAVSTKLVYESLDLQLTQNGGGASVRPLFRVFSDVSDLLHNDLESTTVSMFPEVGEIKRELLNLNADGALMSGSGSTVFGVFENCDTRDAAMTELSNRGWMLYSAEFLGV